MGELPAAGISSAGGPEAASGLPAPGGPPQDGPCRGGRMAPPGDRSLYARVWKGFQASPAAAACRSSSLRQPTTSPALIRPMSYGA